MPLTIRRRLGALGLASATVLATLSATPTSAAGAPSGPPASPPAGALAVVSGVATPTAAARASGVKVINGCLTSKPEPGTQTRIDLCYTLFKPARAGRKRPVPMVLHGHGWGESRTTTPAAFERFTRAGYGVLSFDQRGFGESGGRAHVASPAYEGVDVRKLVRFVSTLKWVEQDGRGDPRLGAIGGSYGGGYQLLGALEEQRRRGKPIFDALAPQVTWNDLTASLAPEGLVRTDWARTLAADAVPSDSLPPAVYRALVEAGDTGHYPDPRSDAADLAALFTRNGPDWQRSQGRRLSIPVLLGQGTTDTLFPLEQGLRTWRTALTPKGRKRSIFVGYNGGHERTDVVPTSLDVSSDPCSERLGGGDFERLTIRFFNEALKQRRRTLTGYGRLHLATTDSTCITRRAPGVTDSVGVGTVVSTRGDDAPVLHELSVGPLTVAGTPYLTGAVTTSGPESRAYYGLAVGSSPEDALLVQDNVLPVYEEDPVSGLSRRVNLPSVAVRVPAGQRLYLLASRVSSTFDTLSPSDPGVVTIDDVVVHLPVVGD